MGGHSGGGVAPHRRLMWRRVVAAIGGLVLLGLTTLVGPAARSAALVHDASADVEAMGRMVTPMAALDKTANDVYWKLLEVRGELLAKGNDAIANAWQAALNAADAAVAGRAAEARAGEALSAANAAKGSADVAVANAWTAAQNAAAANATAGLSRDEAVVAKNNAWTAAQNAAAANSTAGVAKENAWTAAQNAADANSTAALAAAEAALAKEWAFLGHGEIVSRHEDLKDRLTAGFADVMGDLTGVAALRDEVDQLSTDVSASRQEILDELEQLASLVASTAGGSSPAAAEALLDAVAAIGSSIDAVRGEDCHPSDIAQAMIWCPPTQTQARRDAAETRERITATGVELGDLLEQLREAVEAGDAAVVDQLREAVEAVRDEVRQLARDLQGQVDRIMAAPGSAIDFGPSGGLDSVGGLNGWRDAATCIRHTLAGAASGECGGGPEITIVEGVVLRPLSGACDVMPDLSWIRALVGAALVSAASWGAFKAVMAGFSYTPGGA